MLDKRKSLRRTELFCNLDNDAINELDSFARTKTFSAHRPVILPHEDAEFLFVLAKGLVKIGHITTEGKEIILSLVETGEVFGEMHLLGESDTDQYVETIEESTLIMLPVDILQASLRQNPCLLLKLSQLLGHRRRRMERRFRNLLYLSNRDRLIHALLDVAEQFGEEDLEVTRIRIRLSHQDLANLIGSTRETVTMLLGQLKTEGWLNIGRRRLAIKQIDQLALQVNRVWNGCRTWSDTTGLGPEVSCR